LGGLCPTVDLLVSVVENLAMLFKGALDPACVGQDLIECSMNFGAAYILPFIWDSQRLGRFFSRLGRYMIPALLLWLRGTERSHSLAILLRLNNSLGFQKASENRSYKPLKTNARIFSIRLFLKV
jgi:hypothetical protein